MARYLDLFKKTTVQPPNLLQEGVKLDRKFNFTKVRNQIYYPNDLFSEDNHAYILFQRRDPIARGAKLTAGIALYMPPQIQVSYGAQWEPIQMTALQYADVGKDLANTFSTAAFGSRQEVEQLVENSLKGGGLGRSGANILDFFASGSNFGQQLEAATNKTVNPHMALLFKGIEFRTFSFTFKMMAKSVEESNAIRDIIYQFKSAMHPKTEQGTARYWIYPDNFDIFLYTDIGADGAGDAATTYMFQIDTAVLTKMDVNYAGSGIPVFFDSSGAPVEIDLTLNFQELGILTREKIEEGY